MTTNNNYYNNNHSNIIDKQKFASYVLKSLFEHLLGFQFTLFELAYDTFTNNVFFYW